ncbi:MAG: glycosyltransferase family A protein, partial [Actinomycetes bacterium]
QHLHQDHREQQDRRRRADHLHPYRGGSAHTRILAVVSPLVSVVVPVYNGMPHLPELAESLLAQTYENLEIIFSDGGSADGSPEYLASLTDPRVRVIQHEGTGAAGNWTNATQAATGELIKLVCQDDLLNVDAIAKQVSDLQAHPNAVMAIAQRDIIDARGQVLYAARGLAGLKGELLPGADVIRTCYLQGTNVIGEPHMVLFRANELKSALPWDDSNPLMLDLSMYAKVAPTGSVAIRHESIGAFRVSTSSWSTRLVKLQLLQTKQWQHAYARTAVPAVSLPQELRAFAGRHMQTALRRAAYRVLKAKGAFASPTMSAAGENSGGDGA